MTEQGEKLLMKYLLAQNTALNQILNVLAIDLIRYEPVREMVELNTKTLASLQEQTGEFIRCL